MREQIRRAGGYFSRGLAEQEKQILAVQYGEGDDAVVMVVARAGRALDVGERLADILPQGINQRPAGEIASEEERPGQKESSGEARGTGRSSSPESPEEAPPRGELVAFLHEPGEGAPKGSTGHVHFHVRSETRIGRRTRQAGEALCSKKRGSRERPVALTQGMMVCPECVQQATRGGYDVLTQVEYAGVE